MIQHQPCFARRALRPASTSALIPARNFIEGLHCNATLRSKPTSFSLLFYEDGREWARLPYKFAQNEIDLLWECIKRWEGQEHGDVCAMIEVHPVQVFRG